MITLTAHSAGRRHHRATAVITLLLYLATMLAPLAAFAVTHDGHAATAAVECSGDCDLCGCSPESRAAHTCCCAKKRQQQAHRHTDDEKNVPACCKKDKSAPKETVIACGCPCGKGKQAVLSTSDLPEVLPVLPSEQISIPHTDTIFSRKTQRLTSRHGEPPVPPPQI